MRQKKAKAVKYARKVKHGPNVPLIHTRLLMQIWRLASIAKTQIMPRKPKVVKERAADGRIKKMGKAELGSY